jgi:hypothetical protein
VIKVITQRLPAVSRQASLLRVIDYFATERALPPAGRDLPAGRQRLGRHDAVDRLAPHLVEYALLVWGQRLVGRRSPQPADRLPGRDLLEPHHAARSEVQQRRRRQLGG